MLLSDYVSQFLVSQIACVAKYHLLIIMFLGLSYGYNEVNYQVTLFRFSSKGRVPMKKEKLRAERERERGITMRL